MKKLNIAYFGTPYFSARFLEKCLTDPTVNQLTEIKFVVTRPDKPVGRKQIITKSPVKNIAEKYHIPVYDSSICNLGSRIKGLDFAFLYAYGGIIPDDLLHLPKSGFLNTHPSLLPKYRGPSPIAYPLILGENKTGVTLIQLDKEIDHGPIIAQEKLQISTTNRRPDLEIKLTDLAYDMFKKLIIKLAISRVNTLEFKEQNHKQAIFTRMLIKQDGYIPFSLLKKVLKNEKVSKEELPLLIRNSKLEIRNSPKIIYSYFRGLYPWPGIWTILPNGKRLKITDLQHQDKKLTILRVQLEGKKEVDFKTFNKAYKVFTP